MARPRRLVRAPEVAPELLPGQSPELLKELHLLTREGHLNADALRKLKQVNHLVGLLRPAVEDLWQRHDSPVLVDAGSGNSYLSFILYEAFLKPYGRGSILAIEARTELCEQGRERASRLGFDRMSFQAAPIERAAYPERIHLLVALHACDTATDDAIAVAVTHRSDYIAVAPCCQAEVARQLADSRTQVDPALRAFLEHPLHRRELGSLLTNVIRGLVLESMGYQVTVTEFVGWEHSLKGELLLARRLHRENAGARRRLLDLLSLSRVSPKLCRVLDGHAAAAE